MAYESRTGDPTRIKDRTGIAASDAPGPQQLQQAAEWFATLGASRVTASQREQWMDWINAHPSHRAAWHRVELIGGKFAGLPLPDLDRTAARDVLESTARRGIRRRNGLGLAAVVLGAGAFGAWTVARQGPWQAMLASHGTAVGERQQYQLADGTRLWLNTATAVDVEYGTDLRRIRLWQGEVLVETRPDTVTPSRPLVVDTRHGRLQALGTRFSVRLTDDHTQLTVFEAAVRVTPSQDGQTRVVEAGQSLRFTESGLGGIEPASAARQAWSRGFLLAEDMRLDDFLGELSRYRRTQIHCTPDVAGLRLVGSYRLDDIDAILRTLEETLPVRVRRPLPWRVELVAR